MKRKLIIIVVLTMLLTSIAACGSKPQNYEPTEKEIEAALEKTFEELAKESDNYNASTNKESKPQESTKEYKKYDKAPEWANMGYDKWAIQIDDVYYEAGLLLDEVVKKAEASEAGYTIDYNPGRLVDGNKKEELAVKRDGTTWFNIIYRNPCHDIYSAKDCVVVSVAPSKEGMRYSRFFDGRSYDDILNMEYSDITALTEALELKEVARFNFGENISKKYTTEDKDYEGTECIGVTICPAYETDKAVELTGYTVDTETKERFYIDKNTGKVIAYEIDLSAGYLKPATKNVITPEIVEKYKTEIETLLIGDDIEIDNIVGYAYVYDINRDYYTLYLAVKGRVKDYSEGGYFLGELSKPAITVNGVESEWLFGVGIPEYDSLETNY